MAIHAVLPSATAPPGTVGHVGSVAPLVPLPTLARNTKPLGVLGDTTWPPRYAWLASQMGGDVAPGAPSGDQYCALLELVTVPEQVHTTLPSVAVLAPTTVGHTGSVDELDVPAVEHVYTNPLAASGTTACPAVYAVLGSHCGKPPLITTCDTAADMTNVVLANPTPVLLLGTWVPTGQMLPSAKSAGRNQLPTTLPLPCR